jgi:hypothetical protein
MSQELTLPCPTCGSEGAMRIGQSALRGRLRWYRSIDCSACGRSEEDGEGFPPEPIRKTLLESGESVLQIDPQFKAGAARLLKSALGLSLAEVSTRLASLPEVFRGTRTEVEWLQSKAKSDATPATIATR